MSFLNSSKWEHRLHLLEEGCRFYDVFTLYKIDTRPRHNNNKYQQKFKIRSRLMNNNKIYGSHLEQKKVNTIELRSIPMHLEVKYAHTAQHRLMNSDLSLLRNSRAINFIVPLQRRNYAYSCCCHFDFRHVAEIEKVSAHIAHFYPINYSLMIVKYSQLVNTHFNYRFYFWPIPNTRKRTRTYYTWHIKCMLFYVKALYCDSSLIEFYFKIATQTSLFKFACETDSIHSNGWSRKKNVAHTSKFPLKTKK